MNHGWKARVAVALAWLIRCEQFLAVALLVIILLTMGLQVIARYVFLSPISWSEEVARLGLIWLTFIAAGFVAAGRQHIAVELLGRGTDSPVGTDEQGEPKQSKTGGKRWRSAVTRVIFFSPLVNFVVFISTMLLLIGGLRFVWRVYPVGSPGIGLSMTYWYGAASVGLALMALHALADLFGIEQSNAVSDEASVT